MSSAPDNTGAEELEQEWDGVSNEGTPQSDNVSEDSNEEDHDLMSDVEPPKDETEEELEKLVFGDGAGFRDEIHRFAAQGEDDQDLLDSTHTNNDNALAGIQDSDLFFLDNGPSKPADLTAMPDDDEDDRTARYGGAQPAWEDSDDDRMTISLMAAPRLRKLRNFDGEDVISSKEYTRRLRREYQALQPAPQWAKWDSQASRKRRRQSGGGSGDEQSGSDMDLDDDDDDDEEYSAQPLAKLLRSSQSLTRSANGLHTGKRIKLRSEVVAIERMKDIGPTQPHAITCLSIHPTLPLMLSSGLSSTLYLHHLQPRPTPPDPANPLITSLHLKHTPITTATFSPRPTTNTPSTTDPKIYLSSRRRYFHTWNLPTGQITKTTRITGEQASTQRSFETLKASPCGRYLGLLGTTKKGGGVVNILDASTTQWIAQARVESRKGVADFVWWSDGRGMCIAGRDGEISEWSIEARRVLCRWTDEGQVGATVISLGGTTPYANASRKKGAPGLLLGPDRYIATGSTSGIVNIYDRSAWAGNPNESTLPPTHPTPLRTLSNLVTQISHLVFSPCGQILVMSSRWKRDALRLVHLPSCAVYKNWPTSKTPLGRISAVALGEWTDYAGAGGEERKGLVLAVGNEQGVLRGWEITG